MSAPPTPETVLCSTYRDQAARYREAVALAGPLAALLRAGEGHGERLGRVMALLAEVAAIEEHVRPVRERWLSAGGRPGPEFRGVLAEATGLIERLMDGLAAAEREAAARQTSLAPQIDALIRGRAMRRAYSCG